jgi:ankyrin repeat protein
VFSKVWNFYILKASKEGNENVVKLLVENCADLNVKDELGETPMHKGSLAIKFIKNIID